MLTALRKRLDAKSETGFTLIELLVVIIIIGILLAIAVLSRLGFRDRATRSANQANLRAAIPAIETYSADNVGSSSDADLTLATTGYQGMTLGELDDIDAGIARAPLRGPRGERLLRRDRRRRHRVRVLLRARHGGPHRQRCGHAGHLPVRPELDCTTSEGAGDRARPVLARPTFRRPAHCR